jgi:hypothetical protein
MKKIDEMISLLSYVSVEGKDYPNLADVLEVEDLALPLAFAIDYGYATLTEAGEVAIVATYTFLADVAKERGIDDLYEIIFTDEPITPRGMTISLDLVSEEG